MTPSGLKKRWRMRSGSKSLRYMRALGGLSPARLLDLIWHPEMLPVFFFAPGRATLFQIARSLFPDADEKLIGRYRLQLLQNHHFFTALNERFVPLRGRRTNCEGWPEMLYVLVRLAQPERVVETGVFDGISSAVILQALEDNHKGMLISIDLPAQEAIPHSTDRMPDTMLPLGCAPGWAIPDSLRGRHELRLGESRDLLPEIARARPIDIFLHDSLHTFACQWFEYNTAWPRLGPGGLLISDDIFWTPAFHKFSRKTRCSYYVYESIGIIQKPHL